MTEGRILWGAAGGTCRIRLEGDIRFPLAGRFEDFVRRTILGVRFNAIEVDLTAAEHLDSTMLGLLARLAQRVAGGTESRPLVLSTQEDINLLLDTMGFEAVFDIRHEDVVGAPPLAEILDSDADRHLPQNVLDAHRALMDLDDRNRRVFGATVEMLKREVESSKSASDD